MLRATKAKVVPLRKGAAAAPDSPLEAPPPRSPRPFPSVSTMPRLLLSIPDEILDYFGWVFCQGGFSNLHMTFEQFLAVVAKITPTALCPEYDAEIGLSEETL